MSKIAIRPGGRFRGLFRYSLRSFLIACVAAGVFSARYVDWHRQQNQTISAAVATHWDISTGQNVRWAAPIGSVSYATPVIAGGKVFLGTNNAHGYVKRFPADVDLGVLLCFRESDGTLLWQASSPKLSTGRVHDWPLQGVASRPWVEKDRLWYVTNRCELVCLDTEGFHDRKNDGPFRAEANENRDEADVVWLIDLMSSLGVAPHNMSHCDVVVEGSRLFVVLPGGVDEGHIAVQKPAAPSFACFDKTTGRVLWSDSSSTRNIMHAQWSSPVYAVLGGVPQVLMPGGDGWLYSFDARGGAGRNGNLLWKFDCNPKSSKWILGGRGTRNNLIAAPVIANGLVYITVGQDPEHGEGNGHLWCIDPTRRGDVSEELVFNVASPNEPIPHKRIQACVAEDGDFTRANPNSAVVWHYDGQDINGDGKRDFDEEFHRSLNTPAIKGDLLFVADFSGLFHCVDARTGRRHWTYDLLAACWSSPVIAGDHVYIADEDGDIAVFRCSSDPSVAMVLEAPLAEIYVDDSVYGTPVAANGTLYLPTRGMLYAIQEGAGTPAPNSTTPISPQGAQ